MTGTVNLDIMMAVEHAEEILLKELQIQYENARVHFVKTIHKNNPPASQSEQDQARKVYEQASDRYYQTKFKR